MTTMPPSSQIAVIFLAGLLVCRLPQPMGRTSWPSWMFAIVSGLSYYFEKTLGNELFHVPKIKSAPSHSKAAGPYGLLHPGRTTTIMEQDGGKENNPKPSPESQGIPESQSSSFSWINTTCCISFFNFQNSQVVVLNMLSSFIASFW